VHVELEGREAGLLGGVAEVDEGELVFGVVDGGEVDGLFEVGDEVFPLGNQLVVDGVELVGFGAWERRVFEVGCAVFEPGPLDDGGFEERGGGVGVVLEEFGWFA
jgi:hypothetical protein